MVAWMDRDAAGRHARAPVLTHFWSRSRQAPWRKGETSGHVQHVRRRLRRLRRATRSWSRCTRRAWPATPARARASSRPDGRGQGAAGRHAPRSHRVIDRGARPQDGDRPAGSYVAALLEQGRGRRSAGRSARRRPRWSPPPWAARATRAWSRRSPTSGSTRMVLLGQPRRSRCATCSRSSRAGTRRRRPPAAERRVHAAAPPYGGADRRSSCWRSAACAATAPRSSAASSTRPRATG